MTPAPHPLLPPIVNQRSLMRTIRIHSRVASFVTALVLLLLLQISPALGEAPHGGLAMMQSPFPGLPVPSTETARNNDSRPVEVTFTKWVIPGSTTPYSLFAAPGRSQPDCLAGSDV